MILTYGLDPFSGVRPTQVAACLFLLTFGVGVWVVIARPFESPRGKALRLCGECGLDVDEIDWLIDTMRHSTLTRAENLALFRRPMRIFARIVRLRCWMRRRRQHPQRIKPV